MLEDIFGNTLREFTFAGNYTFGSAVDNNLIAIYESNSKTIHLFSDGLEFLQGLELLFPNIDGFRVVSNRLLTWNENRLSVFDFKTSAFQVLDENADVNSITIYGNEMTWKSIDANHFKKLSFDAEGNSIVENMSLVENFDKPQFCYWNDSIVVISDLHASEVENKNISVSSLLKANPNDLSNGYDLLLESLDVTILDTMIMNSAVVYKYRFDFRLTNQGEHPVYGVRLRLVDDDICLTSIIEFIPNIDFIDSGESYSSYFSVDSEYLESMCFYADTQTHTRDDNFGDNFKCFSSDITSTSELHDDRHLVHPNPVVNTLSIENYEGRIKIFSISGKLMLESFLKDKIDISKLQTGIYILQLDNGLTQKIIKM